MGKRIEAPKSLATAVELESAMRFVYGTFLSRTKETYYNKTMYGPQRYKKIMYLQMGNTLELVDAVEVAAEQWASAHQSIRKNQADQIEAVLHSQAAIIREAVKECAKYRGNKTGRTALHRVPTLHGMPGADSKHFCHVPKKLLPEHYPAVKQQRQTEKQAAKRQARDRGP